MSSIITREAHPLFALLLTPTVVRYIMLITGKNIYFVRIVKRILTNHADTHYLGRNIFPVISKYKQCTVSTLLEKYPYLINIPICSAGNA